MTLVECVPNFSEGRRLEVIDEIVAAIAAVDGVHVLDRQSDATHNRCVITFVGPDEAAAQAASSGPTKVITQRLWVASLWRWSTCTPSAAAMAATIWSMTSSRRPSETVS